MLKTIRKYIVKYPLSVLCLVIIWGLSLFPYFPETPLDNVEFIDKWTHLVMYGGTCSVIWWEYLRQHVHTDYEKLFFWAWLMPIVMSGVLELLQEYTTTTRSGEWVDLAANATGVTLGAVIGMIIKQLQFNRK